MAFSTSGRTRTFAFDGQNWTDTAGPIASGKHIALVNDRDMSLSITFPDHLLETLRPFLLQLAQQLKRMVRGRLIQAGDHLLGRTLNNCAIGTSQGEHIQAI